MKKEISLPDKATLKDYQVYIKKIAALRAWDKNSPTEIFLLLSEEIGELAKAVRNRIGLYAEEGVSDLDDEELEYEFADVLNYLFDLANLFDIDLDEAFRSKDAKNAERVWKSKEFE